MKSFTQFLTEQKHSAAVIKKIVSLYKKGLEDFEIADELDIPEADVADVIDDHDKKQQSKGKKK